MAKHPFTSKETANTADDHSQNAEVKKLEAEKVASELAKYETVSPAEAIDIASAFHGYALHMPDAILNDQEKLVSFGKGLRQIEDRLGWYIGDMADSVVKRYGKDSAERLYEAMGYEKKTVSNYQWTSRCYTEAEREAIYAIDKSFPFSLFTDLAKYPQEARMKLFTYRARFNGNLTSKDMRAITTQAPAERDENDPNARPRLVSPKSFELIVKRLENINPKEGTAKALKMKIEKAITPVVAESKPLTPEQAEAIREAEDEVETAKAEVDSIKAELATAKGKQRAKLEAQLKEAEANVKDVMNELVQARSAVVTVPVGANVNPPMPAPSESWIKQINSSDERNIRMLAKRVNDYLNELKPQLERAMHLANDPTRILDASAQWRSNVLECMDALSARSRSVHVALSELSGFIATAREGINAHATKAEDKVNVQTPQAKAS